MGLIIGLHCFVHRNGTKKGKKTGKKKDTKRVTKLMWQIDDVAALHVEINQLVGVFYLLDIEDN
jgi:hypothetical protein